MRLFTLIHINEHEQSIHNNSFVKSFSQQIKLYFDCAKQLHLSLKAVGIELVIITNKKEFLQRLNEDEYAIEIVEKKFSLEVPSGIKFFSAHFKIEIYNFLASLNDEYTGLIDCDIVCINNIPQSFKNIINAKVPLFYDITDQLSPAHGANKIISDKEKLSDRKSIGLWAGGEFISGSPAFFSKLYCEIEKIKPSYFKHFKSLMHQGDEMVTSVAIENLLMNSDIRLMDAGSLSIIGRYWSPKPIHIQKPLKAYSNHFLLHLPSDKKFISRQKKNELKGKAFFRKYHYYLIKTHFLQKAFKSIKPFIKRAK